MSSETVSIFILGCRAAGKTSFLSGLTLLSRPGFDGNFTIVTNDGTTASTVRDLREFAERRQWPAGTSTLTPLNFDLTFSGRSFRLSILDYPGEDLLQAMETMDFESKELIYEHICKADCLLILTDPTQDLITEINLDMKAARRRQDALAQAIGLLVKERQSRGLQDPLVGVVVTKWDLLTANSEFDEKSILKTNQALVKKLQAYARNKGTIQLFPISACGPGAQPGGDASPPEYPENPKPSGYDRLFSWVSDQLFLKKYRKYFPYVVLLIVIVVSSFVWSVASKRQFLESVRRAPVSELGPLLEDQSSLSAKAQKMLDERLDSVFPTLESQFAAATSADDLERLKTEVSVYRHLPFNANKGNFDVLFDDIEDRLEEALFNAIVTAASSGSPGDTLVIIADYQKRFPKGAHIVEVETLADQLQDQQEKIMRQSVRSVRILNRDSIARKVAAIRTYLNAFPGISGSSDIEQALDISGRLSNADEVRLVFRGCSFDHNKRDHRVKWFLDGKELEELTFTSKGECTDSTFEEKLEVGFTQWSKIRVELWDLDLINEKMASAELNVLRDLKGFDGHRFALTPAAEDPWKSVNSWIKIEIELRSSGPGGWRKVSPSEIKAYSKYIYPGDGW